MCKYGCLQPGLAVLVSAARRRCCFRPQMNRQRRVERAEVDANMAAPVDVMFSFCVDPGKVSSCVEVRFIDNVKVSLVHFYRNEEV